MTQIAALFINAEIQTDKPPPGGQFGCSGQENPLPICRGLGAEPGPFSLICTDHVNMIFDLARLFRDAIRMAVAENSKAGISHQLFVKASPTAMDKHIFMYGLVSMLRVTLHALHCAKQS